MSFLTNSRIWYIKCFHTTFLTGQRSRRSKTTHGSKDLLQANMRLSKQWRDSRASSSKRKWSSKAKNWGRRIPPSAIDQSLRISLTMPSSASWPTILERLWKDTGSSAKYISWFIQDMCLGVITAERSSSTKGRSWIWTLQKKSASKSEREARIISSQYGGRIVECHIRSSPAEAVASLISRSFQRGNKQAKAWIERRAKEASITTWLRTGTTRKAKILKGQRAITIRLPPLTYSERYQRHQIKTNASTPRSIGSVKCPKSSTDRRNMAWLDPLQSRRVRSSTQRTRDKPVVSNLRSETPW